ncbi:MAG TPA: glycosyltransferase family 39 protein [Stellaceae bacterium]|nr:glycosyltransferase family 39 protein [Stellaceae bacterium]
MTVGLCFAALALALFTFSDYGISWDEDYHFWYGFRVVDYYRTHFQDTTALTSPPISYYGAAFDAATVLLSKISPLDGYETRHLLNALIGVLGIVGVAKLARELAGPRAGFWAALLLLLTPNYYGHMFNNPKDIPLAVAYVWALFYIVRIVPELPRPTPANVAKLGLAVGLGLGVRVGGLLLLCYLVLAVGAILAVRAWRARSWRLLLAESAVASGRVMLPVLLLAYSIMLLSWPWAQLDPLLRPIQALIDFGHHPYTSKILFDGAYYVAPELPRLYLPVHILLKLPEVLTALAAVALVLGAARLRQRPEPAAERAIAHGIVGLAALFPVAYAVAIHATLFDGMRHFIFVVPPLACLAAIAIDSAAERLTTRPRLRVATSSLLAAYLAQLVYVMVALHPDEYVYYNLLAGGLSGAAGRFKLDYWANSYREAANDLTAWLKAKDGPRFEHEKFRVAACGPPGSIMDFLPPQLVYVADRTKADFYVAFTKDGCDKSIAGRPVARVERLGTLLSVVLDLRKGAAAGQYSTR